ncbi:hypothetical protein GCM10020000_46150 [Streptomyces olivoverticillatus]
MVLAVIGTVLAITMSGDDKGKNGKGGTSPGHKKAAMSVTVTTDAYAAALPVRGASAGLPGAN